MSINNARRVETIIDGSTSPSVITQAIKSYMAGLRAMAFPAELNDLLSITKNGDVLKDGFDQQAKYIATLTKQIILQINIRAKELNDPLYQALQKKDTSLWYKEGQPKPLFGTLVCVDKGISGEAMGIDISNVGRVLAGDIEFSYIPSKQVFFPTASALIKRLIHYGRQGKNIIVEPLIEHTNCGRRGQMLANEQSHGDIPSLRFIFDHLQALYSDYKSVPSANKKLDAIHRVWQQWPRKGAAVVPPDHGLYAGVVQKIAQRQALMQLNNDITIISPIEVYEKETGNLYAGLDQLGILSDTNVVAAGGFTKEVLTTLVKATKIFSLAAHAPYVFQNIERYGNIKQGKRSYYSLQREWLASITDLVAIVETLWDLYNKRNPSVAGMVSSYFQAWKGAAPKNNEAVDRRIIHHLFHVAAYAFLLDTLNKGHEPGTHHRENYLATGDHEIGSKPLIALGQGDLDRPSASEMFTGYSVLLHSSPGHDGTPIPVVIKLDTDRMGDKPMSTEETNVAFDDIREFLKLWPYFLVGDIMPILMVRGKHTGGVSRLGLSIIQSLGDMSILLEQMRTTLPRFVPANNSRGEVVLVPAFKVIQQGILAKGNLKTFRSLMPHLADDHSDKSIQLAFLQAHHN